MLMKPHMKNIFWLLCFFATFVGASLWVAGCTKNESAQGEQLYTCGMHPQVIQNKPGNCPICGMKLTPIRKQGGTSTNANAANSTNATNNGDADARVITIDPATSQNMGLRTGLVTRGPLRRSIRTVGIIDYDETTLAEVSTKFRGWVE